MARPRGIEVHVNFVSCGFSISYSRPSTGFGSHGIVKTSQTLIRINFCVCVTIAPRGVLCQKNVKERHVRHDRTGRRLC